MYLVSKVWQIIHEKFSHRSTMMYMTMFINIFFFSMASGMVYVFLPAFVEKLGVSELSVGYYVGIIGSSTYFGRVLLSVMWGNIADVLGKKCASLVTSVCLLASTLAFGFSHNIYMTIVTRFLQGCCMGQVIISKSMIADICDDKDIIWGMSVIMTASTVGTTVGPSIAGFLVFPAQQYPKLFSKTSPFATFCILFPNLFIAIGLGVGIGMTIMFFPRNQKSCKNNPPLLRPHREEDIVGIKEDFIGDSLDFSLSLRLPTNLGHLKKNQYSFIPGSTILQKIRKSRFIRVLRVKRCILSCLLYGLLSFVTVGFNALFPVLAASERKYNGLEMDTARIGTAILLSSVLVIPLQLTALPKLNLYVGSKNMFIAGNVISTFLYPLLPALATIEDETILLVAVSFLLFFLRVMAFSSTLSVNILLNESVESDLLGCANGAAVTSASIGRLFAPLIYGALYSVSLQNIKGAPGNEDSLGFPFNQYLSFLVMSLYSLIIAVFTLMIRISKTLKDVDQDKTHGTKNQVAS